MKQRNIINVYFPDELLQELRARGMGNGENVVREMMQRYLSLLQMELEAVNLSEEEWWYLRDSLNGFLFEPASPANIRLLPHILAASVEDSAPDGLQEKWGVNAAALASKLRQLRPSQSLAVLDAVERFWASK